MTTEVNDTSIELDNESAVVVPGASLSTLAANEQLQQQNEQQKVLSLYQLGTTSTVRS